MIPVANILLNPLLQSLSYKGFQTCWKRTAPSRSTLYQVSEKPLGADHTSKMPQPTVMQPHPTQHAPDTDTHSHRGPLSRTWPQLFKKRRRYSPVRESAQSQAQQTPIQQQPQHQPSQIQQPQPQPQPQFQASVPIRPIKQPSISTQSIRSPSIAADTASTKSTISEISSLPPQQPSKRVPIARRTSSIATTDSNGTSSLPFQTLPKHINFTAHINLHTNC